MKLKPCPFCGGEAASFEAKGPYSAYVRCSACDVDLHGYTESAAIEGWNRRAALSAHGEAGGGADAKNWADIAERYRQAMMKAEALINSTPMPVVQDGRTSMLWKRISDAADVLRAARHGVIWGYDHASPAAPSPTAGEASEMADAPEEQAQWHPIETAPHEVNVLLAYWDELTGRWHMEAGMASWGWRRDGICNMSRHGRATHWLPLPQPPAEAEAGHDH